MTVEPFRAIAISRLAHQLKTEGRSIIHMEFGQPSTPAPAAALAAVREALDRDPPGYWESVPLRKEKVIGPGVTTSMVIKYLEPGEYSFFDDFHPDAPPALLIAK